MVSPEITGADEGHKRRPKMCRSLGKGPWGLRLLASPGNVGSLMSITIGDRQSGGSTPLQDTPKLEYGWAYEIIQPERWLRI